MKETSIRKSAMFRKNRLLAVSAILLVIAIINYTRISNPSHIRTVEFLSIFAIGALTAVVIMQAKRLRS